MMKFVIVVVVVACIMLIAARIRRDSLQRSDSMHADSSAPVMQDVHAAIARGEKIRAIKIYRELTGAGLRTAKDAVDRIESGQEPDGGKER